MALDHASARSSAININLPFRTRMPFPDGNIVKQDRAHIAYMYILASGSSASPTGAGEYIITFRRRRK